MDNELEDHVRRLIADLIAGRYADIAADGRAGRLSARELRTAVEEYGRTLVPLPDEGWDLVDTYPQDANPSVFALDVPLWTAEEGRSDLTLSLTATKHRETYSVEVDDLHVL
jgi:hypothetical protein